MMDGTIIFAHRDEALLKRMEEAICLISPQIHVERAASGADAVMMQAFLRADVLVLEAALADASVEHVVYELKRDVVNPYVMIYERNEQAQRKWLGLGADEVIGVQVNVMQLCEEIEQRIRRRAETEGQAHLMAERLLQRLFMEYGIPCSLKGYRFLKTGLAILSGRTSREAGTMNRLYEKIGERHGCSSACAERNIRYVIDLCWSRSPYADRPRPGNAEFIAQILEDAVKTKDTVFDPKISIYCSERRIFK